MTAERDALADRVRAALPPGRPVREVRMFGGLSFMVEESMVVSVGGAGDLLVRLDPARYDELLGVPGAQPAVMGERPMGPGWIRVAPGGLAGAEQLGFWLQVGLDHRSAAELRRRGPAAR